MTITQSIAGLNAWALHQNPQIYGVDAASFRPERWLEHAKDSPVLKAMEACYATFGFGSRTCVGRNIAMMEIYKVCAFFCLLCGEARWEKADCGIAAADDHSGF